MEYRRGRITVSVPPISVKLKLGNLGGDGVFPRIVEKTSFADNDGRFSKWEDFPSPGFPGFVILIRNFVKECK
jgi:hypothetical protein